MKSDDGDAKGFHFRCWPAEWGPQEPSPCLEMYVKSAEQAWAWYNELGKCGVACQVRVDVDGSDSSGYAGSGSSGKDKPS